jgi:hypothetical protein
LREAAVFAERELKKLGEDPDNQSLYFSDQRFNDMAARASEPASNLMKRWMAWPDNCDSISTAIGGLSGLGYLKFIF